MERYERIKLLIDKLITDEEFRRSFLAAPEKVAAEEGWDLTAQEIALLKSAEDLEELAEEIEQRISKSACMVTP
jgi:hypothetical protein